MAYQTEPCRNIFLKNRLFFGVFHAKLSVKSEKKDRKAEKVPWLSFC